jgi:hypothetical protein
MPVIIPAMVGLITPNLVATGNLGSNTPQLATGIATGLQQWIPSIVVQTTDAGSLGVGSGGPMPLVVPQPVLYGGLMTGAASAGVLGIMAPALFLGISNGIVMACAQMLIKTTHPGVGVGTGLAKFIGGSAVGAMIAGFAAAGMTGQATVQIATAVGIGLDITFQALAIPVPIVGSASPTGGSGVGVGNII